MVNLSSYQKGSIKISAWEIRGKFAASAPAEVVAEARENLAARTEERDKLPEALDRLAEIG